LHAKNITHILNVTPPKEAGVQVGLSYLLDSLLFWPLHLTLFSTHSPREMVSGIDFRSCCTLGRSFQFL
jgi:hypothetical protein